MLSRIGTTWNLRTSLKAGSCGMRSMLQQREIKRETTERDKEREREVMDFAEIWRILLFLEGLSIKFWQTFMVRWMWPGPFQSNGMQMSCAVDSRGTFWCGRVDLKIHGVYHSELVEQVYRVYCFIFFYTNIRLTKPVTAEIIGWPWSTGASGW